jgi:hypothetical protein
VYVNLVFLHQVGNAAGVGIYYFLLAFYHLAKINPQVIQFYTVGSKSMGSVMVMFRRIEQCFDGIQPTFRQVPPRVLYFSIMAVFMPNWAQRIAAT